MRFLKRPHKCAMATFPTEHGMRAALTEAYARCCNLRDLNTVVDTSSHSYNGLCFVFIKGRRIALEQKNWQEQPNFFDAQI